MPQFFTAVVHTARIGVETSSFPLLTAMVVVPAVVAFAIWLIPSLHRYAKDIGLATTLVVLVGAIYALAVFDYSHASSYQLSETYMWIPQLGISWATGINGMGLSMVVLAAVLTPLVLVADWHRETMETAQEKEERRKKQDDILSDKVACECTARQDAGYVALVLACLAFIMMIFVARDVVVFYLAFEAMLVPMYFLIGSYGHGVARKAAALKFLLYSLAGGLVMLIGVVMLFAYAPRMEDGSVDPHMYTVEFLSAHLHVPFHVELGIFLSFFIAFAIKAPMVPVHTWLADAAANARPATSTILVGVMDKIGTYGMIAFCLVLFPKASHAAALPIVALAVVSILWGAVAALAQKDLLRLISFTSVSHFGLMVMGIFIGNKTALMGTMIYMVAHGLSIAGLFLISGFLCFRGKTQTISEFGGLQKVVPVLAGTFLVSGLAAVALPGLSGFVPELLVLLGSFHVAPWAGVCAVLAVVIAAVYMLLPYQKIFTGSTRQRLAHMPDLTNREKWAVVAPLIVLMLFVGLFPQPLAHMVSQVSDTSVLQPMTSGERNHQASVIDYQQIDAKRPQVSFISQPRQLVSTDATFAEGMDE